MSVRFSIALLVALVFGSGSAGEFALAQPALTKIVVASPSSDDVTPALYAQQAGIFKKYGLDVDLQRMPSGAAIAAAIAGGSVSFGLINTLSITLAHAHGVPLQIVAPGGLYAGDDAALLVVPAGAPFKTARDLNGKVIGSPGVRDLNSLATMAWIDKNGGDSSTVKVIEVPASAIGPALAEGRIDMATVQVPALTGVLVSGQARAFAKSWTAIAPKFLLSAWIASSDYIAKNPDATRRFADAIREATRYTNEHHAETLAAISTFSGVDAATIAKGTRSNPPPYADPKMLQPIVDFAVRYKLVDTGFDAKELVYPGSLPPNG
jgi:NitT/TauT family transport system substrate-binding protein